MANFQYTIGLKADTSQAQANLKALERSLSNISKMHLEVAVEDSGINKASAAAQELQQHLQKAINADTGKLNLNQFNNSLQGANTSLTILSKGLLEAGQQGTQAFMQLASAISNAEAPIKQMNSTLKNWGTTLKNTIKWELSSTAVHGIESALAGAVSYAKNLNSSLTDIRIVTGQSVADMAKFAQQANRAAKELSTTTKAYADASLIYYQQGDSAEQAAKKAAITIKAANSSFNTSAAEMSEYLTAVWNSYQVGADELERYVDIMAALGAKTATSLEEIATSMQKVAATSNTVGVSMEQVSSIIATVSSVTRESAESIGTAYKTIFARIGDLKLGETLEDGVTLGQVSSQLKSVGVSVLDANGDLRDMGTIIEDLMSKWETMTRAEQTAVAQVVAGKRQYTQWMALMENSDMYKQNIDIATNAEGSLQEMADIAAESWEAASKRVTAAMEKIYSSLINDQAMINLLKTVEKVVETLGGMVDGFGGLGGIIANFGGMLTNYFSADIAQGLTKGITNLKSYFQGLGNVQDQFLQTSRQFRKELEAIDQDSAALSSSDKYELSAMLEVAKVKEQMALSSKNITAEQVQEIEGVVAAYQKEVAAIVELQRKREELDKKAEKDTDDLVSGVLHDEAESYGYHNVSLAKKREIMEQANESILTDALNLEIEVDVELGGTKLNKQISTVSETLNNVFKSMGKETPKTFTDLVAQTKKLTNGLGQAKSILEQMSATGGKMGENLFNADKSVDELITDLQKYAAAYQEITGSDIFTQQMQTLTMDGMVPSKEQIQSMFSDIQNAFISFQGQASINVKQLQAIILRIVPDNLKDKFKALFQEWSDGAYLAESAADRMESAIKRATSKMQADTNKAFSAMAAKIQGLIEVASALESIVGVFNSFKGMTETLSDPDATGWEKFGATISFVTSVLMSLKQITDAAKVIQGAYNALVAIGVGLELADAAAKEQNAKAQRDKNKAVQEGIVTETVENIVDSVGEGTKNTVGEITEEAISTAMSSKTGGQKALAAAKGLGSKIAGIFTKAVPFLKAAGGVLIKALPYVAIAAAVAGAIYLVATADKRFMEGIEKETKRIKEATDKNKQEIQTLTTDTAALSAIMQDTTLTYEEQIEKINEIAAAYGIQATAVDALTGSYSRFASQLISVGRVKAQENAETAADNASAAYVNMGAVMSKKGIALGRPAKQDEQWAWQEKYGNAALYTSLGQTNGRTGEEEFNAQQHGVAGTTDKVIAYKAAYGQGEHYIFKDINTNDTSRASLLSDAAWTNNGTDRTWKSNNGDITGILNLIESGKMDPTKFLSAEGQIWNNEQFREGLMNYGFIFDPNNLSLEAAWGMEQDWVGLYQFLSSYEELLPFLADANSYTSKVIAQMDTLQIGQYIDSEQTRMNAEAINNLWNNDTFVNTAFGTQATKVSTQDMLALVKSTNPENFAAQQAVINEMSQYGAYSDAGATLNALYSLADEAVDINPTMEIKPQIDQEVAKSAIVEKLLELFPDIDLETILRISPTEIVIDQDGNVSLSPESQAYIDSLTTVTKAQKKQAALVDNKDLLTKESYTDADYRQLVELEESGVLGPDFNAETFARQSVATRTAEVTRMQEEAINAETEALTAQIDAAKAREEKYGAEFKAWEDNFNNSALGQEQSYEARRAEIATWTAERDQLNAAIKEYDALSDTDKQKFDWSKYGVEGVGAEGYTAAIAQRDGLNQSIETGNNLIKDGIELETTWLTAVSDRQNAEAELEGNQFYENWTKKVNKATEAAKGFSEAIGQQGKLTAEQLNILSQYDSNLLSNYENMTADQWNEHVYQLAMEHYRQLEELYKDDAAMLIQIQQEKEAAEEAYYNGLKEKANAAAQAQQEAWDEATEAADSAMSSAKNLMEGEVNFTNIEKLKQDLLDAGVAEERVIELLKEIESAGDNEGKIKAAMVAASEAALAKLGTLHEQKQEYTGLVTTLDTSPIEPINLKVGATTGEVDDGTLEQTKEDFESDPLTPTFTSPEGGEEVAEEVASWGEGKTVTFTDVNGEIVEATISGYGENQTITYTDITTGQEVTKKVSELGNGQTVTFTDATTGEKVTATIASFGSGQIITYTNANGEAITGVVAGFGANQTLTYINANGTAVSGTISGFGDNLTLIYTGANGTNAATTIAGFGAGQTLSYTTAIASGDLASVIAGFGSGQTITYINANGEAVTSTITSFGANQTLTFTTANGESVTGTIASFGSAQKLIYTTADGTTVVSDIQGFGANQTITFTTVAQGTTLQASISAIGKGQTIEFTDPQTGATFTDTIESWTFTNDGLVLNLASGAQTTVATTVAGWTGLVNNSVTVGLSSTAEEGIQRVLSQMDLSVEVQVKTNLSQNAVGEMKRRLMTDLDDAELAEVMAFGTMDNDAISQTLLANDANFFDKLFGGKDEVIKWSDTEKVAMTEMVSNILEMSPEDFTAALQDENSIVSTIIKALIGALEHGDAETKQLATFLLQGLGTGMQAECASFDWSKYLANLGPDVIKAFEKALGIASPSKLTKALAPWLFLGLSEGIAEADATFTIKPLEGVRGVIAKSFQDALKGALADGALTDAEIDELSLDPKLAEHYNNIMKMDGETQAEKFENYKQSIGQAAVDDYIQRQGQLAYDNAVATNQQANSQPRGPSGFHMVDIEGRSSNPFYINPDQARAEAEAAARADTARLQEIREAAIKSFVEEFTSLSESSIAAFDADYIKNQKWNEEDSGMSDVQKAIINGAVEKALQQGGWSSIDEALEKGGTRFVEMVQANLDESGKNLELEISETWASLQDIWVSGLGAIYEAETALAQQVYELWESTFQAIAKARLGLIDGKSIIESLFDSPDDLSSIIESWLNEGMTMSEILTKLKDPNATVDFTPWDAENYHKSGPQRFLNRDKNGMYTDTTVDQYNANVDSYVDTTLRTHLSDVITDSLTASEIKEMQESEDPAQLAFLEYLYGLKLLTKDNDGNYIINAESGEIRADEIPVLDEVLDSVADNMYLDTQQEVNTVLGDAASTQQAQYWKRADTLRQEGEQFVKTQQENLDLVSKARQALLAGEDLTDKLTKSEQQQLLTLTNQTDLNAISLSNLDTATNTLAETMVTAASQIAIAMGMIQSGQADNWQIDPKTGQVTAYKTMTVKEAREAGYTLTKEQEATAVANRDAVVAPPKGSADKAILMQLDADNTTNLPLLPNKEQANLWRDYQRDRREAYDNTVVSVAIPIGGTAANAGETITNAAGADMTALNQQWDDYANAVNYARSEFQDYAQTLYETSGGQGELLNQSASLQQEYMRLAESMLQIEQAWDDLSNSQSSNIEILKKGRKGTGEYSKALGSLTKTVKKVFGGAEKVTEKFVESHLDDIEKMAEGDEEALERVEDALISDILGKDYNVKVKVDLDKDGMNDAVGDVIDSFNDLEVTLDGVSQKLGDIKEGSVITPSIDPSGATQGLLDLLNAGGETAAAIQAALEAIGWTPEVDYEEYDLTSTGEVDGKVTYTYVDNTGKIHTTTGGADGVNEETLKIRVPKIGSNGAVQYKGLRKTGAGTSSTHTPNKSGGGGGGGKPKEIDIKDPNDEKERYHEINQRLERMSQLLDKVSKYKDRAFGKSYLKNLEQEIKLMKQQEGMYERKLNEAKEWLDYDKSRLAEFGVTYDEMGNISNYDEVIEAAVAEYNAFVERYNAMSADEQKTSDENEEQQKAEEKLENLKEYISDYEDSLNNVYDLQNSILDAQNQQSALALETIQYKAEYQIEINEEDIELLEYFDKKWEETLEKQDDRLAGMIEHSAELQDNLSLLAVEQQELNDAYAQGDINMADYVEGLRSVKDDIMENLEALKEIQDTINELYGETLDMISEKVSEQTDHINAATEAMGSYITILGLMGRGKNFRELESFYEKQVEYSLENAKAQRQHLDLLLQEKEYYDNIVRSGGELNETQKIWYQDLLTAIDEANSELLSSTEEVLNNIASEYENVINGIFKELDEVMGGAEGSLAGLADEYSYYTETQERYVTSAKELYEVSKLNRDIEQSIEDTTTTASKQMLAALKERINAQSELNELTEYDIEMNRLQYELALAKIGLEEAENAKDTVRLTRDESGNYVYQYTANDDKINEAQQQYEDVLQQINELAYNRTTELEQMFLDAQQQYYDAAQEIANDTTLTVEERTVKLNELYSRFCETQQYIQEQYQSATGHLMTSNTTIAQHYNDTLTAQAMNSRENINETIAGMIEDNQTYKDAFLDTINQINEAQTAQQTKMDEVAAATLTDYGSMIGEVERYDQAVENAGLKLDEVLGDGSETEGMLKQIKDLGSTWGDFAKILDETVIPKFETLLGNIVDTIRELANLEDTVKNTDLTPPGTGDSDNISGGDKTEGTNDTAGTGGNPGTNNPSDERWYYGGYTADETFIGGSNCYATTESYAYTLASNKGIIDVRVGKSPISAWRKYGLKSATKGEFGGTYDTFAEANSALKGGQMRLNLAEKKMLPITIEDTFYRDASVIKKFKTGGLADFTGPAWLDGTKSSPELVLNATDTQNMLSAIGTLRELDTDTIAMLVSTLNAATASLFGALSGNYHAAGVSNTNTQELNQNVEIHADFPNVTDRNEIVEAIDDLVNRAAQFAQKKTW